MSAAQVVTRNPFPALPGPFAVGSFDRLLVDESRTDPYTSDPNDRRHLLLKFWYPAQPGDGAAFAPYVPDLAELSASARTLLEPVLTLPSRSCLDAPVAAAAGTCPLLIYSHGAGSSRFGASFVTEALASSGFVVAAIDHPGANQCLNFPDGYRFEAAHHRPKPPGPDTDLATHMRATFAMLAEHYFPVWVDDARFVLDQIENWASSDDFPLASALDLKRVGSFGWSLGGAAALQRLADDPRIRAAMVHDGMLYGSVARQAPKRPFMILHNGDDSSAGDAVQEELAAEAREPAYRICAEAAHRPSLVEIAGSNHGSFADILALPIDLGIDPGAASTVARHHALITALTLEFFDRHLRGAAPGPALRGDTQRWPDLRIWSQP